MSASARSLEPWRWIGVPLVQCLAWTVVFAVPLRVFGLQAPEPVFPMWPIFAWAMIRPSILAPFAVLIAGLFLDLLWGAPLGLWAVSLLVGYGIVLGTRSMMVGQSPPILWAWYAAVTALSFGAASLITLSQTHAVPSVLALFWQYLATIVLYPFANRLIERFEDADVRFR